MFTRYIVNDKIPGQPNEYPELNVVDSGFNTWDLGRKTCFQDKNTALVLYKPKAYLSKKVRSMRLCICFPAKVTEPVQEVWIGGERIINYSGASKDIKSIYIKDGEVYMAFHPLITNHYGIKDFIRAELVNDYFIISLYNYEGEERDFARRGFVLTGNGFACEIRSAYEFESFAAFRKSCGNFTVEDSFETSPHTRQTYTRITKYKTEKSLLACEYSPCSEGIRYQTVNGETFDGIKLFATGLNK